LLGDSEHFVVKVRRGRMNVWVWVRRSDDLLVEERGLVGFREIGLGRVRNPS